MREAVQWSPHAAMERPPSLLETKTSPQAVVVAVVFVAVALLGGGYFGYRYWDAKANPPYAVLETRAAGVEDAYASGGAPLPTDAELRGALVSALSQLSAASGNREVDAVGPKLEALRAPAQAYLGDDADEFLRVFGQVPALLGPTTAKPQRDAFSEAVAAWNQKHLASGGAFFIDVQQRVKSEGAGMTTVLAMSYDVQRIRVFADGDRTWRTLDLRRLDGLNYSRSVLGFNDGTFDGSVTLLGRVEEKVVAEILPALAPDGHLVLGTYEHQEDTPPWLDALQKRAAADVRSGLKRTLDADALTELGIIAKRRQVLYREVEKDLDKRGFVVRLPQPYRLEERHFERAKDEMKGRHWRAMMAIIDELGTAEHCKTFLEVRDAIVESVVAHELQHAIDRGEDRRGRSVEAFERWWTPERQLELALARSAISEASGYLAEIARSGPLSLLATAGLARYIAQRDLWGKAESYAAVVALDGIAGHLEIEHDALVIGRKLQPEAAAALYIAMSDKGAAAVADAAEATWRDLYGTDLPELSS